MAEKTVQQKYNEVYGGHCDEGLVARIEARLRRELSDEDTAWIMQWRTAKSYAEILKLNCAFLRGDQELNPVHMGPPQPSKTEEPEWAQCACCPKWSWFSCRQRAYLTFLFPGPGELVTEEVFGEFVGHLMSDPRIYVTFCRGKTGFGRIPENWETHEHKKADTVEGVKDAEARCEQAFELEDPDILKHFSTETKVMDKVDPFQVCVLATSWDEDDLPGVVEQAVIASGVKRIFTS
ncbi:hypothetical protein LTR97_011783 [Elasticomyces elasticus]|uniref:Uncharacterized protein n=1 Tax=Elasticomyces elasticus TaxID=574655 RepID=A0AAN7VZW0_9PEZI|nr:hypothetical protein LTR97_011783 [Elasticomyces elasticus]